VVKILLDYRPALRQRTGVGEYVHQLAKALGGRRRTGQDDASVDVFTSSWKDRPSGPALAELAGLAEVIDRRLPVKVLNAAWHRLELPPVEWLTGRRYDVVHSPNPLLIPTRHAARVVTIHDLDFLRHPERTRGEMRSTYPMLVARHAARADGILVDSRHVGEQVQSLLHVDADRISVCPIGVVPWPSPARVAPGNPDGRYILFFGTLEPRKNVDGLLAAYASLVARRPDVPPLRLVGGSVPGAEGWRETIASPPLAGRVVYDGYVDAARRQEIYEGARLFVLPSFDEGFGLTVVEAMSLGVPVVASTAGSLPEVTGGAALLVDPEDLAGLSLEMERVLFDPGLAKRLAEDGLRQARQFTWERAADLTFAAYGRAIEARRGRVGD
jgi:glycosyltransferase involved in cell wall biosynthesis